MTRGPSRRVGHVIAEYSTVRAGTPPSSNARYFTGPRPAPQILQQLHARMHSWLGSFSSQLTTLVQKNASICKEACISLSFRGAHGYP